MSKKFNKYQEATLGNVIKRIIHDPIYRSRWTLTLSMLWYVFLFGFYLALGIIATQQTESWSWFHGLAIWYLTFLVFKIILEVNLFKRIKGRRAIDFKLLSAIFLFISFGEMTFIAFYPAFFETVFANQLTKTLKITTYVINSVNILFFLLSFWPVKRENFTRNEARFIITKHYVSRMGGIFNFLIIIINTMFVFNLHVDYAWVVGIVYFAVSMVFAIMCLVLAIKSLVMRHRDNVKMQKSIEKRKRTISAKK